MKNIIGYQFWDRILACSHQLIIKYSVTALKLVLTYTCTDIILCVSTFIPLKFSILDKIFTILVSERALLLLYFFYITEVLGQALNIY